MRCVDSNCWRGGNCSDVDDLKLFLLILVSVSSLGREGRCRVLIQKIGAGICFVCSSCFDVFFLGRFSVDCSGLVEEEKSRVVVKMWKFVYFGGILILLFDVT